MLDEWLYECLMEVSADWDRSTGITARAASSARLLVIPVVRALSIRADNVWCCTQLDCISLMMPQGFTDQCFDDLAVAAKQQHGCIETTS